MFPQVMNSTNTSPDTRNFYRAVLDANPSPVFVVEEDVLIVDYNSSAGAMISQDRKQVVHKRAGDILHCVHSTETPEGCGRSPYCRNCIVRNSVNESLNGQRLIRQKVQMELIVNGVEIEAPFLVTTTPLNFEDKKLVVVIFEDISEITALKQLLPICSSCKQVRNDGQYWQTVESYFETHLNVDFTMPNTTTVQISTS